MFCPKCASVLVRRHGELTCVPGDMGLSRHLEALLTERYGLHTPPLRGGVSSAETASWYCPGCGVSLASDLRCPQCQQSLQDLQYPLTEFHPHAEPPRDARVRDELDLRALQTEVNLGYLPQPIPTARDAEIRALMSQVMDSRSIARFSNRLRDGESTVLEAFAERMATLAVRNRDPTILEAGLIALLLSPSPDSRESLIVFALFCDAIVRLGIDHSTLIASLRSTLGDRLATPFLELLKRPEHNRSLHSMGYVEGADADGFRYIRTW
jgi:uncharacterized Zn finger protein (UPF0148 family)